MGTNLQDTHLEHPSSVLFEFACCTHLRTVVPLAMLGEPSSRCWVGWGSLGGCADAHIMQAAHFASCCTRPCCNKRAHVRRLVELGSVFISAV